MGEIEFGQRVQDCLTNGRSLLLIVGDRIYPAATQLAEVIQSAPHLQFTIGFVELTPYRLGAESKWPLIVVPRLITKSNEVTRAVVKDVYEEKRPDITIETIDNTTAGEKKGRTTFDEFIAALPSKLSDIFRLCIERWAKDGYTLYWGKVGFSVQIPWKSRLVTVFEGYPDSLSIFQTKRVSQDRLPEEGYSQYRASLMEVPTIATALASRRRYIYYDKLAYSDIEAVINATSELLKSWFDSEE